MINCFIATPSAYCFIVLLLHC